MKKFAFLFLVLQTSLLFAAEQSVTLSISGMTCAVCPVTIKKSLQKVEGVKTVSVSYENKTVAIVFNDQIASIEKLLKAAENSGYPAMLIKNNP
ncbi:MAG: mercuric transport protein periplasmic component [Methylococcaceae bacterium]|nr:mercuric transport protein periplasmic component [Methylococcaceae bacterium]